MSTATEAAVGMPIDAATRAAVADLCRRFRVQRLDIFGSAVREDFDPARSDVDLLVNFEPDVQLSFAEHMDFVEALEAVFGRKVDLITEALIRNPYLRREINAERKPLFPGT